MDAHTGLASLAGRRGDDCNAAALRLSVAKSNSGTCSQAGVPAAAAAVAAAAAAAAVVTQEQPAAAAPCVQPAVDPAVVHS
eukprot:1190229-Prorocentrum_minimum.AAC.4